MKSPTAQGKLILYLDFDGVLHHENCLWHPRRGAYLDAPAGHRLFQHAELLAAELEPFPDVQIVLSTSWVLRYGYSRSRDRLPESLAKRCIGATFHSRYMRKNLFSCMPRGAQILDDVERRMPCAWIAVDDMEPGWPAGSCWVQTDPVQGLEGPGVLGALQEALLDMHLPPTGDGEIT
jgi:hypothetical protein